MKYQTRLDKHEEESQVLAASKGDLEAFNQLVLSYQDLAYNHALLILGDPASAEDATQESFIKAFENIARFRGGSFRAWLLKIITNSAYDNLRRSKRHPMQPLFPQDETGDEMDSASWLADPSPSVQATVEQNEFSRDISRAIDEVPDPFRAVLTLVDLYELDYAEAAQTLKVPIGTVKSRLARARLRFGQSLKGYTSYGTSSVSTNSSSFGSYVREVTGGEIT
ncbi:MAG TPA: sigma-70 family RNA polymerase sigma factor [Anaerolineales bacterium]|nr:sigma-70 family RNA polymerase sigma factor [Anaerolineales bacterium]